MVYYYPEPSRTFSLKTLTSIRELQRNPRITFVSAASLVGGGANDVILKDSSLNEETDYAKGDDEIWRNMICNYAPNLKQRSSCSEKDGLD